MPNPQKAKGSAWERDVAKHLSDMYNETFIRAPGSGAYIGGTNAKRKTVLHEGQIRAFKGDIVPGESFPKFNAECKSYADFPFHQLFNNCRQLEEWLEQLLDVEDDGDFNILIMKFNRKGKYIAVEEKHKLQASTHITYHSQTQRSWRFYEYDDFWHHNQAQVKKLCK